ncbi:DUF4174 domain-containing protein [Pontibaca methylaminivorans]|uniref:DUF4174 domain-containing protein n=1 Tax=Pontibaca methylaminivorans TaxID=515897 RepID=UPI002FD9A0CC
MKNILLLVLALLTPQALHALDAGADDETELIRPAGENDLAEFLWVARPIIIFADSPSDPRFLQQIEYIEADSPALLARDVVVLTDTDPGARQPLRQQLRPRGFMLVLIDKEGAVTQRKPLPWSVREITRAIDKTPERRREIDERRGRH